MLVRDIVLRIFDYETSGGKNVIKEYLNQLVISERTAGYTIREKIRNDGLSAFDGLRARQLMKKLWEIKFSSNRLMYVIADQDSIYFVHACKKQKGKAEKFELATAIARVKELEKELGRRFL